MILKSCTNNYCNSTTLRLLPILHDIVNGPHDQVLSSNMHATMPYKYKFLTEFVSSTLLLVSVHYFTLCLQSCSSCSMAINIAHPHTYTYTCMHACMHACTHTHTHTHIHTHTHKHVHYVCTNIVNIHILYMYSHIKLHIYIEIMVGYQTFSTFLC